MGTSKAVGLRPANPSAVDVLLEEEEDEAVSPLPQQSTEQNSGTRVREVHCRSMLAVVLQELTSVHKVEVGITTHFWATAIAVSRSDER